MDLSQHAFQNINLLGREALHRTFEHADKYLGHAISEFAPSASQFKPYDTPVTTAALPQQQSSLLYAIEQSRDGTRVNPIPARQLTGGRAAAAPHHEQHAGLRAREAKS